MPERPSQSLDLNSNKNLCQGLKAEFHRELWSACVEAEEFKAENPTSLHTFMTDFLLSAESVKKNPDKILSPAPRRVYLEGILLADVVVHRQHGDVKTGQQDTSQDAVLFLIYRNNKAKSQTNIAGHF